LHKINTKENNDKREVEHSSDKTIIR